MAFTDVVLFGCHWRVYLNHFVSSQKSHDNQFLITEKDYFYGLRTRPIAAANA